MSAQFLNYTDGLGLESIGSASVAIVGAGLAGTATTVRLLKYLSAGSAVTLFEKHSVNFPGGLAYNEKRTTSFHFLNLQAGRISMFREKRLDFIEWANNADRSDWSITLGAFRDVKYEISTAVPRLLYQKYLRERLATSVLQSQERVNFLHRIEEVLDVTIDDEKATILTAEHSYAFDYVILATGNLSLRTPKVLEEFANHPRVIVDQYDLADRARLPNIGANENVFVFGSGLRAYDFLIDLRSLRNTPGAGLIYFCSRNGKIHPVYSTDHEHDIIHLPRPEFLNAETLDEKSAVEGILEELKRLNELLGHVPSNIRVERIIKAWERWVPEFLRKVGPELARVLHSKYWGLVTTSRIGMVNEIGIAVTESILTDNLKIIAGTVSNIESLGGDDSGFRISISVDDEIRDLEVDWIANCVGRETNYFFVDSELWRNLVKRGLAVPHIATGRGIEAEPLGSLLNSHGHVVPRIATAGVMREGAETQYNGRLGSFVFSIGPVRNNALQAAALIMIRIYLGHQVSEWSEGILRERTASGKALDIHVRDLFYSKHQRWISVCRDWLSMENPHSKSVSFIEIVSDLRANGISDQMQIARCCALCLVMAVESLVDTSLVSTGAV